MFSTFAPRIAAVLLLAVAMLLPATFADGAQKSKKKGKGPDNVAAPEASGAISPTPFRERNGKDVFNASGVVPLGDSHFAFVDNNVNDALLALRLSADGQQAQPIVRMPLTGLAPGTVDDLEDLSFAEIDGQRFIFATPSFSMMGGKKSKGGEGAVRPSALLRIRVGADGALSTESMTDFREWLLRSVPVLAAAANRSADVGGLNVEGLGWDAKTRTLLLGIRTPIVNGLPIVVPVRLKAAAGPWTTANLEALEPIRLEIDQSAGPQGIRGITETSDGTAFLVVVGNATSKDPAPFSVYRWDGLASGKVTRLPYTFSSRMKPEGLTTGIVGGKPAVVFVDDGGGFSVFRP